MNRARLYGLIGIGAVIVAAALLAWYFTAKSTLHVSVDPPNEQIVINGGQTYTVTSTTDIQLKPGRYQVTAKRSGYDSQTKTVQLKFRQATNVAFTLELASQPQFYSAIQAPAGITPLKGGVDYKIVDPHYFENDTWAVALFVDTTGENADGSYVVFQRVGSGWTKVTSGTSFDSSTQAIVPASVYQYLQSVTQGQP